MVKKGITSSWKKTGFLIWHSCYYHIGSIFAWKESTVFYNFCFADDCPSSGFSASATIFLIHVWCLKSYLDHALITDTWVILWSLNIFSLHIWIRFIFWSKRFTAVFSEGKYVMLCTIWYHLYNIKNVKNIHDGLLLLVKLGFQLLTIFATRSISRFLNCANGTKSRIPLARFRVRYCANFR